MKIQTATKVAFSFLIKNNLIVTWVAANLFYLNNDNSDQGRSQLIQEEYVHCDYGRCQLILTE